METLKAYEKATKKLRVADQDKLFLATVKPHKPVAPSTIARWLRAVLDKAGIDTGISKAHSTRGASTSALIEQELQLPKSCKLRTGVLSQSFKSFITNQSRMQGLGQQCCHHYCKTCSYKLPQLICEMEPSEV